ncbi:MAG: hypothetical protein ACOCRK_09860 [bacterium]
MRIMGNNKDIYLFYTSDKVEDELNKVINDSYNKDGDAEAKIISKEMANYLVENKLATYNENGIIASYKTPIIDKILSQKLSPEASICKNCQIKALTTIALISLAIIAMVTLL